MQMSRNILVDGNRAAIRHGAPGHGQRPAVLKLVDDVTGVRKERFVYPVPDIFLRVRRTGACGNPQLEDLRERHSWLYGAGSKTIHAAV